METQSQCYLHSFLSFFSPLLLAGGGGGGGRGGGGVSQTALPEFSLLLIGASWARVLLAGAFFLS